MQLEELIKEAKKESENSEMTVGQAIDSYINAKENVLSPVTIRCYRKYREKWLQGLMDIPLPELNNILVQNEINKESQHLSPKSLRNAYGLLSAAIRMQTPSFTLNVTLPSREQKFKDLPEPKEVIQAIQGTDIELPCLLALWLSLRMSEVCGIKYSDISGNILTIQRTIVTFDGHHVEKNQTKTYSSTRQHVLPDRIMELINQCKETADSDDDYIITLCGQTISKKFIRLLEKNHVKRMTFHELRHIKQTKRTYFKSTKISQISPCIKNSPVSVEMKQESFNFDCTDFQDNFLLIKLILIMKIIIYISANFFIIFIDKEVSATTFSHNN